MQLHIIARGKIGKSPEAELVARYVKRMSWPLTITELAENGGKDAPPPPPNSRRVLLDEKGKDLSSGRDSVLAGPTDSTMQSGQGRTCLSPSDG